MRLMLVLVLLATMGLAGAPARADEVAHCGGYAPLQRVCRTTFLAPVDQIEISFRWYGAFAGRLEGTLTSSTGSRSLECVVVDAVGPVLFSCRAGAPTGVFIPAQEVSLRGDTLGSGAWEVFVQTNAPPEE